MKPSAIIIGASSGIGLELCRYLVTKDYRIGIAARRKPLLDEMAASLTQICCVSEIDAARPDEAIQCFKSMTRAVAPVDFVYICAGTGHPNPDLKWEPEDETIRVNALGFAALASTAMSYFLKQGHGHLVGITSVAAVRGSSDAPAYGATKAFESHYLESLRIRARKSGVPISVTEIRPGFVKTAMMKAEKPFWVASPVVAARQIVAAAEARKSIAYVTARWRLVAWLMRMLPNMIYDRVA
ncbi:MAG: SDR family NAD(P)-dependent oxidoreductase [Nitrospirota bacterium]